MDVNTMKKLIGAFSKLYDLRDIEDNDRPYVPKGCARERFYMDRTNVSGIRFFVNDNFNKWFYATFDVTKNKAPELDYITKSKEVPEAKYSIEYLLPYLKVFDILGISPIIKMKNDYPITLIAEGYFEIIIAPRVEDR